MVPSAWVYLIIVPIIKNTTMALTILPAIKYTMGIIELHLHIIQCLDLEVRSNRRKEP